MLIEPQTPALVNLLFILPWTFSSSRRFSQSRKHQFKKIWLCSFLYANGTIVHHPSSSLTYQPSQQPQAAPCLVPRKVAKPEIRRTKNSTVEQLTLPILHARVRILPWHSQERGAG